MAVPSGKFAARAISRPASTVAPDAARLHHGDMTYAPQRNGSETCRPGSSGVRRMSSPNARMRWIRPPSSGEDDHLHLLTAQDDLMECGHLAIDIARSGRSRKGDSTAGMFESGRTSGCRSMPSEADMKARR